MKLTCPTHAVLRDLVIEGAQSNGLNADDGGDRDRPAGPLTLRRVTVRESGGPGNRDGFKLSGVDRLRMDDCAAVRWGGGQGIDLVGCHDAEIRDCRVDGGGAAWFGLQAKGGSRGVLFADCRVEGVTERCVNLGGSTGLAFFRPDDAPHEAADITVRGCELVGGAAAVAFVGSDGGRVENCVCFGQTRFPFRVLQETRGDRFVPARGGTVVGNVVVWRSDDVRTLVNVGGGYGSGYLPLHRERVVRRGERRRPAAAAAARDGEGEPVRRGPGLEGPAGRPDAGRHPGGAGGPVRGRGVDFGGTDPVPDSTSSMLRHVPQNRPAARVLLLAAVAASAAARPAAGADPPAAREPAAGDAAGDRVTARRTLLNDRGHLLRGTKLVVGKKLPEATAFTLREESWREVRSLGLNTVRLCWVDPWYANRGYDHWTVAEALPKLDAAVANAKATDTTVILNYQPVGEFQNGNRDFTRLRAFWEAVAPRYADEPRVIYEIVNEPAFDQAVYFDPAFRGPLLDIYRQIRRDAPDRHVLAFSVNSIDHELTRIVDAYADELDWDRTTVAFHLYGGGGTTERVRTLLRSYPAICTETDYPGTHPYVHRLDGRELTIQNCEDLGVSWVDWSDWDDTSLSKIRDVLIPDAKAKGYWWGVSGGPPGGSDPPAIRDYSGERTIAAAGGDGVLTADGGAVTLAAANGGTAWILRRRDDGRYRLAAAGGRADRRRGPGRGRLRPPAGRRVALPTLADRTGG